MLSPFDGISLPFPDDHFDVVLFIDVLHHTEDPTILLQEAARVSRRWIILKDHLLKGLFAGPTLRFMDRVGNSRHGVALPFNYWRQDKWSDAFSELGLSVDEWRSRIGLYWWPASWIFDRSLHFMARLKVEPPAPDRFA